MFSNEWDKQGPSACSCRCREGCWLGVGGWLFYHAVITKLKCVVTWGFSGRQTRLIRGVECCHRKLNSTPSFSYLGLGEQCKQELLVVWAVLGLSHVESLWPLVQKCSVPLAAEVALKLHFGCPEVLSTVENQALGVQIGHSISSSFWQFWFCSLWFSFTFLKPW